MAGQLVHDEVVAGNSRRVSRHRGGVARGLLAAQIVVLGALPPSLEAAVELSPAPADRPVGSLERGSPRMGSAMAAQDRWALNMAFAMALERVQVKGACGALFDGLRKDGVSALLGAVYSPAQTASDMALCDTGVLAVTEVAGSRTRFCPALRNLSRHDLARILIHEALHHAGMSEAPFDPQAPTSPGITSTVKKSCGL